MQHGEWCKALFAVEANEVCGPTYHLDREPKLCLLLVALNPLLVAETEQYFYPRRDDASLTYASSVKQSRIAWGHISGNPSPLSLKQTFLHEAVCAACRRCLLYINLSKVANNMYTKYFSNMLSSDLFALFLPFFSRRAHCTFTLSPKISLSVSCISPYEQERQSKLDDLQDEEKGILERQAVSMLSLWAPVFVRSYWKAC